MYGKIVNVPRGIFAFGDDEEGEIVEGLGHIYGNDKYISFAWNTHPEILAEEIKISYDSMEPIIYYPK